MSLQNNQSRSSVEESGAAYERVNSLFQIDTLAAQQFNDTYRRKTPHQSEVRLMLAILEDAINCYQDNVFALNKKRIQLFQEAEEWFMKDDASWIFSFVSICSILNLEPDYFRQGLKRWTAAQRASRRSKPRQPVHLNRLVA